MLEYRVKARRVDALGSVATTKAAVIVLDTALDGRPDAFNPAELFLAAIAACMIKGIERVTPMLDFKLTRRRGPPSRHPPGQPAKDRIGRLRTDC